ncbi:MAG: hypothetical protein ABL879_00440 [Devosia sp.]
MQQVAQTNIQLFNQMYAQQRSDHDLRLVKAAYDASTVLSAGYYQADGKPFVCHGVGVASIMCFAGMPARYLAFGILHNIYQNGDFGGGLKTPVTPYKRAFIRERVGAEVEELIYRFRDMRVTTSTIDRIEAGLPGYDETERLLIATDLADHIEKYVDAGVLYFGDGSWISNQTSAHGDRLIGLAERLGQPVLARMMREAFAAVDGKAPMPEAVRPPKNRKYVALTLPLSARPKFLARMRGKLERSLHKMKARKSVAPQAPAPEMSSAPVPKT